MCRAWPRHIFGVCIRFLRMHDLKVSGISRLFVTQQSLLSTSSCRRLHVSDSFFLHTLRMLNIHTRGISLHVPVCSIITKALIFHNIFGSCLSGLVGHHDLGCSEPPQLSDFTCFNRVCTYKFVYKALEVIHNLTGSRSQGIKSPRQEVPSLPQQGRTDTRC